MSKITDRIETAIAPVLARMGYRLVDIEIGKEEGSAVLTVFIAHPEGIGLDDCEAVSHAIDPIIDEIDPIQGAYYLCVSSPGIDRPLKRAADFVHAVGKEVEIRLYRAEDGKKTIVGTLVAFDEAADAFCVRAEDGREFTILRKDAARVKPVVML